MKGRVNIINTNDLQINEKIKENEVRVINNDGEQLGVLNIKDALLKAQEAGLDLVMISPNANPPVCKIIDFGKYRYELMRKEKEAKKKQKQIEIKEIRMTPSIDVNDFKTKINAGRKFLEKGNKLKVTIRFRGREMTRTENAQHLLTDFANELSDISAVEKEAKLEGRNMSIMLVSKN